MARARLARWLLIMLGCVALVVVAVLIVEPRGSPSRPAPPSAEQHAQQAVMSDPRPAARVRTIRFRGPAGRSMLSLYNTPTTSSQPSKIITDGHGGYWFTEQATDAIGHVTASKQFVEYRAPTLHGEPFALALARDGGVWFTELAAGKIGRVDAAGRITEFPLPDVNAQPYALTAGPDGRIWFTEYGSGKVGALDDAGHLHEYSLPSATAAPAGIASAGGSLWITESAYGVSKLVKMSTAGRAQQYPFSSREAQPFGIVAAGATLWIAELSGRIAHADLSGRLREYVVPAAGATPLDLTIAHRAVWFTDTSSDSLGRVTLARGRARIVEYPLPVRADALGIAAGPRGGVVTTNYILSAVGVFTPSPLGHGR
jgi:streptogramin lyase